MVLTVLMLISMLTVYTVAADVQAFSTAYSDTVIPSSALLVDVTITDDEVTNGATITRNWDGTDYTFVVGTNAFQSVAAAYDYAAEQSITNPDIIALSTEETVVVETTSRIFSPAWNTLPMNEMDNPYDDTNSFNAIASEGADWTAKKYYTISAKK